MTLPEVTFKQFRSVMEKRCRTVDELVELFRGKLDENRPFFERVMSCRSYNRETSRPEDRSEVIIPYRSVIEYYLKEKSYLESTESEQRSKKRIELTPEQREKRRQRMIEFNSKRKKSETDEN